MKTEDKYQFTKEEIKMIAWEFWCASFNEAWDDQVYNIVEDMYSVDFEEYWEKFEKTIEYSII